MRKVLAVAVVLAMVVSATASAAPIGNKGIDVKQSQLFVGGNGANPRTASVPYSNGFETSNGYPVATGQTLDNQGPAGLVWQTSGTNLPWASLRATNPATGSQHSRLDLDTAQAAGVNRLSRTPSFSPAVTAPTLVKQDMNVAGLTGGADYRMSTGTITSSGYFAFTTEMFAWNGDYNGDYVYGDIFVVDDVACNGTVTAPVIGQWTPGVYQNWAMSLDPTAPCGQRVKYYLNGTLLYSGNFPFAVAGNPSAFTEFGTWSDNFQVGGDFADIDNVSATAKVPEPATLALLGLGALSLIRRRR